MKSRTLWVLLVLFALWSSPAAADNRFIVRGSSGLDGLQDVCLVLGCHVGGGLDGSLGRLFLVTTPDFVDPNAFLQILRSQQGVRHIEPDALLKVMQATATAPPSGLSDNAPVDYFGATVIHGYVGQPAIAIIRLSDTQTTFSVGGAGTVAVIDTGVDPTHPVLQSVLVPGYDFTRNIAGSASELADVNQSSSSRGTSPASDGEPIDGCSSRSSIGTQSRTATIPGVWPRDHGVGHHSPRGPYRAHHASESFQSRWNGLFVRCLASYTFRGAARDKSG